MSEDETSESSTCIPAKIGKERPCFVVFLRLLLKYLQKHGDRDTHKRLQERVRICTEKANRQEPGYECIAKTILQEIPKIVQASDLRRVQAVLQLRVRRQKEEARQKTGSADKDNKGSDSYGCEKFDIFQQVSAMKSKDSDDCGCS